MLTQGTYIADRYEILEKVGSGGMADVYKAKDHILGRIVAVKVLKQELAEDMNFVTKFRTEAQSAAGLEHPNIVNIYDVGSQNRMYYIVMEFIEGITLKTYIQRKGQLNYKEAVSIAIQVAKGIEAAHNKQIIHRDIKPQNIIISKEGQVKVTDFGIARVASHTTIHSEVMGSVHYSSPEQARNGFIDRRSDIYSLGIVMYEMVTGRVPYDGDTTVAVAIQHLQEEMVSPETYAKGLPISVQRIIQKCTQKSPDRRYENMGALLADLKRSLVDPDVDFVVMNVPSQDKTRIINEEEVNSIKASKSPISPDFDEDEEEEGEGDGEGFLNPKMERAVTIMGIVAAVVIVMIVLFIVGSAFDLFRFGPGLFNRDPQVEEPVDEEGDEVAIPEVVGMTLDQARSALNELGFGIYNGEPVSSDDMAEGLVAEQDPASGTMVTRPTTENPVRVTVRISSGVGDVDVPNVVSMTENAAVRALENAGFVPRRDFQFSDEPEGTVIDQTPAAGTSARAGETVTYVLSQGRQTVQMPDVRGRSEADARSVIEGAGLDIGNITSEYSDNVPEGSVISQSIPQGQTVNPGTSVNLVLSRGRQTQFYSFNGSVTAPDATYQSAVIQLFKAESDEVIPINGQASITATSFPVNFSASNIADASRGTLVIQWTIVTTTTVPPNPDGTGGSTTEETSTREEQREVFFSAQ